jgi:glyoxylase-like metal-dependent hydrolase (beta-lactamase superfamily II)
MPRIGTHRLIPVLDSVVRQEPRFYYRNSPADLWSAHPEMLDADGRVELFMGGYVLQSSERIILIDTGVGPAGWTAPSGASLPGGFLTSNLRVAGIPLETVTDVVFTHLHPDHVGWAAVDGVPVFPNATYRCHRADWDYFVDSGCGDPTVGPRLQPIAARFETWDRDGQLMTGVDLVHSPGHTPGSTMVVISDPGGDRALLLGDVVHCPLELVTEELETFGDVDPEGARRTRDRIGDELAGSPTLIGAGHFPGLQFGRLLVGQSNRRRWSFIPT